MYDVADRLGVVEWDLQGCADRLDILEWYMKRLGRSLLLE